MQSLPGFSEETAANPFATFAAIPVRARYEFLLDNAEYELNTFIKGPVCNGSIAVNAIQAQFFVHFLLRRQVPSADQVSDWSPADDANAPFQDVRTCPGV